MLPRPQHFRSLEEWAQRLTETLERQNQVRWLAERFEQGANLTFVYNPGKNTITINGNVGGTDLTYNTGTRLLESSTGADVTLPLFSNTEAGLTPASGGGSDNFLRADGTWVPPAVATNLSYNITTRLLESSSGTDVTLPLFSSADPGLVPGSGGGTDKFLRADGTWAVPETNIAVFDLDDGNAVADGAFDLSDGNAVTGGTFLVDDGSAV